MDDETRALRAELRDLLGRWDAHVDANVVADLLRATALEYEGLGTELAIQSETPDAPTWDDTLKLVHLPFETPSALERQLPDFLDVGAVCIDLDLPLMADLTLRVHGAGHAVDLKARSVQRTGDGVAVQVFVDHDTRDKLQRLPAQMRQSPGGPAPAAPVTPPAGAEQEEAAERPGRPRLDDLVADDDPVKIWELWETRLDDALLEIAGAGWTGLLELRDATRKLIVISAGELFEIESQPPRQSETLEHLLSSAGKLDDDEVATATTYADTHGLTVGEALLNLRLVAFEDLRVARKTRLRYLLGELWDFGEEARFFTIERVPAGMDVDPIPINQAVFQRWTEIYEEDRVRLEEAEDRLVGHRVALAEDAPPSERLHLVGAQTDLLRIDLERPRAVSEILKFSRSMRLETVAGLELLVKIGVLQLFERGAVSSVTAQHLEHIDLQHSKISVESHFEFMGLHWSAFPAEIEETYREMMSSLESQEVVEIADGVVQDKIEAVRSRLRDAYLVLRDDDARQEHRAAVVDRHQIESSLEMFEAQADTAKLRRDVGAAVDFMRRVVELRPSDREAVDQLHALQGLMERSDFTG